MSVYCGLQLEADTIGKLGHCELFQQGNVLAWQMDKLNINQVSTSYILASSLKRSTKRSSLQVGVEELPDLASLCHPTRQVLHQASLYTALHCTDRCWCSPRG